MAQLVGNDISQAVVSEPEIKAFEARWKEDQSTDCCTIDSFRINLRGAPKTPWNISASRVFARSFVHLHNFDSDPKTLITISNCAITRIKALCYKLVKLMTLSASKRLEVERSACRRGRKATVSENTTSLLYSN